MKNEKVIIIDPVHPDLVSSLKKKFISVNYYPEINYQKLSKIIKDYEVIILRSGLKLDTYLLDRATSLKIIARAGVGMDNIDITEAKKKKIKYFNIPSQSNSSVAEHAFGLLYSAARKISLCDRLLRKNIWKKKEMYGYELSHKNLGIVGLGKIGNKVASLGKKFNMKIYANVENINKKRKKTLIKNKNNFNLTQETFKVS